jgi:hypothetical protein
MYSEEKQTSNQVSDVSADATVGTDMLVNNLVYRQPSALSLATQRSYARHFPQVQTYSAGQTMVMDLTSGSSYIDAENSYLTFKVQLTTSAGAITANFGSGSAMNLIRQVTIRSRSGTELDRVELANVWSRLEYSNQLSDAYLTRQGAMEGWGATRSSADPAVLSDTVATRFCIPLCRLSHFFKPAQKGQKLPPQLISGLHVEIIFEDVRTACTLVAPSVAGSFSGYTVSNIALVTDSIMMTDDVQRTINTESARNGLEICYDRVFTAQTALAIGSSSANISVRKAVSQCKIAYTVCMDKTKILDVSADSFLSVPFDATTWQYRIGSLYLPREQIQTDGTIADASESYLQQLQTWQKLKNTMEESSVSLADFRSKSGVLAASFERDQELELSALPVNNSRTVELDVQFSAVTSPALTRQLVTFLQYCSVSRSFIDSTSSSI